MTKKYIGIAKVNKLPFLMPKEIKDSIINYETGFYQHKFTVRSQKSPEASVISSQSMHSDVMGEIPGQNPHIHPDTSTLHHSLYK